MVNDSINWVMIIFAALFGLGMVYGIARMVIGSIAPETDRTIQLSSIQRDAKLHFAFLFEKGYTFSQLDYVAHHQAGWHFQLDSPDAQFSIILDQQHVPLLAFGTDKTDKRYQIYLAAMIYYLSDSQVFLGRSYYDDDLTSRNHSFRKIADLLKTYIDQIENYSQDDFEKTKHELSEIQDAYGDLLVQEFEQRQKLRRL